MEPLLNTSSHQMGLDWWRKQQRLYPFNSNPPLLEQCQRRAEDLHSTGETKRDMKKDKQRWRVLIRNKILLQFIRIKLLLNYLFLFFHLKPKNKNPVIFQRLFWSSIIVFILFLFHKNIKGYGTGYYFVRNVFICIKDLKMKNIGQVLIQGMNILCCINKPQEKTKFHLGQRD